MARTIKLRESELTNIIKTISEQSLLLERRWKWDWELMYKDLKGLINWYGIGSTIWGWFSDSRLKKNIRRVGKSPSGIPIYEFEYKNKYRFGSGTYRGVLAEHAPKRAVKTHYNGYKMVDYSQIDVNFQKINTGKKVIQLSESDVKRVVKKVINEKYMGDYGSPGPYYPDEPWNEMGTGRQDPMAPGNEELEVDVDVETGRGGRGGGNPTQHPQWGEFESLGMAGVAALRKVSEANFVGDLQGEIQDMIAFVERAVNNPWEVDPTEWPAQKRKWWQLWGHIKDRYKKCACGTDPESWDQSCC